MQYVNDDMDDLFRKAAEGYPLDTSGSDWDKVLNALEGQEKKTAEKKTDHRRLLWLLMLLPASLVCTYYINGKGDNKGTEKIFSTGLPKVNSSGKAGSSSINNDDFQKVHGGSYHSADLLTGSAQNLTVATVPDKQHHDHKTGNSSHHGSINNSSAVNPFGDIEANQPDQTGNIQEQKANSRASAYYTSFIGLDRTRPGKASIHPDAELSAVSQQKINKIEVGRNQKRFYVGLMGGIDATTVHFQEKSKNGVDYGLVFGYRLGRKWSIEAGAFMDRKYYYTSGEYLKTGYMPPNTWITDADGYCRMWDLSIGGTYSLAQGKNSGWFAGAGITSYIMKKESYDYTYYYATYGTSAVHSKSYDNESKELFSVVNLSGGYTHRLGKNTNLRVEPYVKTPIHNLGVNQLPLFSTGIHIGVTRKLF